MSDETSTPSQAGNGNTRLKVLLAILAVALVGFAYDYLVARPSVELAYDQIVERSIEANSKSANQGVFTNLDVRELLGKEPSETFNDDNGDMVEVFSWRSGLPVKSHNLYAVYKPSGNKQMFYRHAKYKYDASSQVSDFSVPIIVQQDPDSIESPAGGEPSMEPQYGGGGGPGGGGPGGGFDPETFFAEQDEDGDGVWADDEIPERAQGNIDEIDTDSDGTISKEEWLARIAARRASGGGRGPGGRRPGGGPEDLFNQRDADEDGLLKGDEIPEFARSQLEEIDTDGDGAISRDEMRSRVADEENVRNGGSQGRRPPLETESSQAPEKTEAEPAADIEADQPETSDE